MATKNSNASYMSEKHIYHSGNPKNHRLKLSSKTRRFSSNPFKKLRGFAIAITGMFAIAFIFLSMVPTMSLLNVGEADNRGTTISTANALFCSDQMGMGMDKKGRWENTFTGIPFSNDSNRTWTLQEAIGGYPSFVSYHGEGKSEDALAQGLIGEKEPNDYSEKMNDKDKANKLRGLTHCTFDAIPTLIANGVMGLSGAVTGLAQFFAVTAFNPDFICASPDKNSPQNEAGCVNLLSIIGGNSSGTDKGIIGVLSNGIYFPLIIIAVFAAAMWILITGFAQKKLREALWGFIWVFLSVIVGTMLLMKPALLVSAPMKVSNTVSTCILGAFSATNCFTGNSSAGDAIMKNDTSSLVCNSYSPSSGNLSQQMKVSVNNMTCNIWKAFVLNPYSVGSFGASYDDFESKSGKFGAIVAKEDSKLPDSVTPETYCISLTSSKSPDAMKGKTAYMDGNKNVCNLVAYQLFLENDLAMKSDAGSKEEVVKINGGSDSRWYNVVYGAQSTNGMWSAWTGGFNQLGASFLSLFMSILGTIIIFVTALMALVYYLSAAILMSLAPLFFLFAIHPGRGKALMLGWLEKVVSNVLKYIASAMFLVVTIAMYSALLKNISNMGVTLLLVMIVSLALFLYRKEIIDLIGKVNMGGEQLSSKFSDTVGGKAKKAMDKSKAIGVGAIGGAVGAKLAGGDAFSGVKDGAMREIKKGQGLIANSARQMDRTSVANRQKLNREQAQDDSRAMMAEQLATQKTKEHDSAVIDTSNAQKEFDRRDDILEEKTSQVEKFDGIHDDTLRDFATDVKKGIAEKVLSDIEVKFNRDIAAAEREKVNKLSDLSVKHDRGELSDTQFKKSTESVETKFEQRTKRAEIERTSAIEQSGNVIDGRNKMVDNFAASQSLQKDIDEFKANLIIAKENNDLKGIQEANNSITMAENEIITLQKDIPTKLAGQLDTAFTTKLQKNLSAEGIDAKANVMEELAIADIEATRAENNLQSAQKDRDDLKSQMDTAKDKASTLRETSDVKKEVVDSINPGDLVTPKNIRKRTEKIENSKQPIVIPSTDDDDDDK